MDLTKFENATLNIQKQNATQANVSFQGKAAAGAGEIGELYAKARAELLADPALSGFSIVPNSEDVILRQSSSSLQTSFKLAKPKA